MIDARVGRLLGASLHQAIADELPQRLEFYEEWLRGEGMRDGTIGLAPITGVLGFLRTEGDAYQRVVARGGTLAAEWSMATLSPVRRRLMASLPRPLRARAGLGVARTIAQNLCTTTGVRARVHRGRASLLVRDSLFCAVRERQAQPLCGYYAALAAETLRQLGLKAEGRTESCRSTGAPACGLVVEFH